MTSNRIIRSFTLCAIAMLLLAACSIFDDYPHRRQYDVILRVTDSTGQVLPDSVASVKTLYAFRNGIFYGKYMAEEDGVIRITYEDRDSMTFVAMTSDPNNLCEITEPEIGESIHNVWLQLKTQGDSLASDLSEIFYGKLTTLIYADGQQEQKKTICIIRKTKCYRFTKRNVPKRKTKRLRYRCPPEPYSNSVRTDFFSYSNAIILENQQINTSI